MKNVILVSITMVLTSFGSHAIFFNLPKIEESIALTDVYAESSPEGEQAKRDCVSKLNRSAEKLIKIGFTSLDDLTLVFSKGFVLSDSSKTNSVVFCSQTYAK